jgi:hypothetical protein
MPKLMVFVDGTWLYHNTPRLGQSFGRSDFRVDFGKLPVVLAKAIEQQIGPIELDVVRTYIFGSYPANHDLLDEELVERQLDFYGTLREEYHYEVETFPIDFRGRRVRRSDRAPEDQFEQKEKCVDIALATSMLYFAAIPGAYDVAVAVVGDEDFQPALQHVRRLGKRVAIASIKGSCSARYVDPRDEARVKDFDVIWLDDHLAELELKYERQRLECKSATHRGDRFVWTDYRPRRGQPFYCSPCREAFVRQKRDAQAQFMAQAPPGQGQVRTEGPALPGQVLTGVVTSKKVREGYQFGFIAASDGRDYYFNPFDVSGGLSFEALEEGSPVEFEVKRVAVDGAGAARAVRRPANEAV